MGSEESCKTSVCVSVVCVIAIGNDFRVIEGNLTQWQISAVCLLGHTAVQDESGIRFCCLWSSTDPELVVTLGC